MVEVIRPRGLTTQERAEILYQRWMADHLAHRPEDLGEFDRLVSFGEHLMERSMGIDRRTEGIPLARISLL